MKIFSQWKKRLSLLYVTCFVLILLGDAIVNSTAYQEQYGSELLKLFSVYMGLVFWVWMLIELMTNIARTEKIKNPWLWSILVVLTYIIGALVYFVVIYYPQQNIDENEI